MCVCVCTVVADASFVKLDLLRISGPSYVSTCKLQFKAVTFENSELPLRWDLRKVLPTLGYDVHSESNPFSRRMFEMSKPLKTMWAATGTNFIAESERELQ